MIYLKKRDLSNSDLTVLDWISRAPYQAPISNVLKILVPILCLPIRLFCWIVEDVENKIFTISHFRRGSTFWSFHVILYCTYVGVAGVEPVSTREYQGLTARWPTADKHGSDWGVYGMLSRRRWWGLDLWLRQPDGSLIWNAAKVNDSISYQATWEIITIPDFLFDCTSTWLLHIGCVQNRSCKCTWTVTFPTRWPLVTFNSRFNFTRLTDINRIVFTVSLANDHINTWPILQIICRSVRTFKRIVAYCKTHSIVLMLLSSRSSGSWQLPLGLILYNL